MREDLGPAARLISDFKISRPWPPISTGAATGSCGVGGGVRVEAAVDLWWGGVVVNQSDGEWLIQGEPLA
jgi:hypothetical protein